MRGFPKTFFAAVPLILACTGAMAQSSFPSRPIRVIVPFAAGSTTDQVARFIGQHVTEQTRQPVVVENKPGANGIIGIQYALSQPADGYTVIITTSTTHASNASLYRKMPYDPVADFVPIAGISLGGMVLAVSPTVKAENVPELIALARDKPGTLTFGSASSWTLAGGELFKQQAKVDILHIPYKAMSAVVGDIIGGRVDMTFGDSLSIMPQVRNGKLRALGVSTRNRMPGLETVPTIAEQGVPGYELSGWVAAFAPKGTPAEVADKLNEVITTAVRMPEAARLFGESGWRPMPMSRQELADFQKKDIERWSRIVKTAKMELE
ncbi:Bug family tripartite tricarboxylate transporter substrate binding protein [Cupriavidus sp. a3]|uniref:Bug family tripartite tricarboxylate transporter substrate binding protein n=1 Tax=Cupriavidus sp. a3 TaxID=3242158 RepID=UPI003D9C5181